MRQILLSAILMIATSIPGGTLGQPTPTSEIAPMGKLRVALMGWQPILVTNKPDGSISGVSVDLAKFIADKLGVAFHPVVYPDPEAYTRSLGKEEWDIAVGPRRPTEAAFIDYSPDFMLFDNMYVAAPGRDFTHAGEVDRPKVKVAVIKDGAPDEFLSRNLKFAELVRIPGGRKVAVETLRSGKADVLGSNAETVQAVAASLPGAKIIPGQFNSVPIAVAFHQGRSSAAQGKLAEIVNEAKRTGVVAKAIEQAGFKGVVRVAPD